MELTKTKSNGNGLTRLADEFFNTDFFRMPRLSDVESALSRMAVTPSVNITENSDSYDIELAAPGLSKDEFKVEVDKGLLTVSAEKQKESKVEKKDYRRREFSYESFSRSFELPENSVPEKIDAHYEHGVLKLKLPKKEITQDSTKKEIRVS